MVNSPIPGFITRKQASEICERAERTLQRYWSRAIEHADSNVLDHLKLHTEDGETIEGREVSKDLIEDLKKQGKNPTWFVHEVWVKETYGPRTEDQSKSPPQESVQARGDRPHQPDTDQTIDTVTIPKMVLEDLREELKVKNDQIRQANERDRETHVLMRDLHELLRDMQQRLPTSTPAALPVVTKKHDVTQTREATPVRQSASTEGHIVMEAQAAPAKQRTDAEPSHPQPKTSPRKQSPTRSPKKRQTTKAKRKKLSKNTESVFAKHTPTFHKAVTGLFRR